MKRIIKLTESDLEQIVKKVIKEQTGPGLTSFTNLNNTSKARTNNRQFPKSDINPKKLKIGDGGKQSPEKANDVRELQQKLINLGFLKLKSNKTTGYFGNLTLQALDTYNGGGLSKTFDSINKNTSKKVNSTQTAISGKFSEQVRRQLQYMKNSNLLSNEKFTIVDDINNQVHAFENGYKLVKTFYVITGKDKGDELKTQSMIDFAINPTNWPKISKAYKSTDKQDVATKIKNCYFNNWEIKNTPSGVFRRAGFLQNFTNDLLLTSLLESVYGKQYVTWETCDGNTIPFGFHGTQSKDRLEALNAKEAFSKQSCKKRNMSFGCINFKDQDVPIMNDFITAGQLSIWLPDKTNEIVEIPQNCISGTLGKIWNKI
jgi:hypothetical protein